MPDAWQGANAKGVAAYRKAKDRGADVVEANKSYNRAFGAAKSRLKAAKNRARAGNDDAEYRRQDYT